MLLSLVRLFSRESISGWGSSKLFSVLCGILEYVCAQEVLVRKIRRKLKFISVPFILTAASAFLHQRPDHSQHRCLAQPQALSCPLEAVSCLPVLGPGGELGTGESHSE